MDYVKNLCTCSSFKSMCFMHIIANNVLKMHFIRIDRGAKIDWYIVKHEVDIK